MDTLIQIAQILFILSVLVILHEFGHYIPAKIFKVRVEKFYLFMDAGFSLFKKKIKDTEWGIGWLPIGGYVKLSGMIDESMDKAQMAEPAQPWEFKSKKPYQRLIIMLGGITVNIILAWLIYTFSYTYYGQKYIATNELQKNGLSFGDVGQTIGFKNGDKIVSVDGQFQVKFNRMIIDILLGDKIVVERNGVEKTLVLSDENKKELLSKEGRNFIAPRIKGAEIDSVISGKQAQKAGLLKGDKIVFLNKIPITYFDEFKNAIKNIKNDSVTIAIIRNKTPLTIKAKTDTRGELGFIAKTYSKEELKRFQVVNEMNLFEAIPLAVEESYTQFVYNIKQFKLLLKPKTEAYKQIKSPIGITRQLPTHWEWEFVWSFMAMFSIGLAFMNLLPIPGLDGGHALFTIAEMFTGRTLSIKAAERVQTFGMIVLLSFMALTFGKDIYEIIIDNFFSK